jgi:hypothetical protein
MVILKIPIVYLCVVVYYAIKAKPKPPAGAAVTVRLDPEDDGDQGYRWRSRRRRVPRRPHGGPSRTYPRVPRTAYARAGRDRS